MRLRVSQVISLVWLGNVVLLGATGYAFWLFLQERNRQNKIEKAEWPEAKAPDVIQRWPGPVTKFQVIWITPLDGPLPPPPELEGPSKPVERSPREKFKTRIALVTVFQSTVPTSSYAVVTDTDRPGNQIPLAPGESVDDWQLVRVAVEGESGVAEATFRRQGDPEGDLVLRTPEPVVPDLTKEYPFPPPPQVDSETVPRGKVARQAYLDPETGEWFVPVPEQDWWQVWGEKDVLEKTTFVERPQGLEFASAPPRGPLSSGRGIDAGDLLVSINGVAVRTLQDVLGYLRGDGREKTRFVVVIERDGAKRTQVYNLPGRRMPERRE